MKILIIEDEPLLAESISSFLESQQIHCEIAPDLNTADMKLADKDFDCILLDIGLPDGNGLQILKRLKHDKKNEGVIIISAKNSLDDKIKGLDLGADDYLTKPFHLSELNARIAAIIRRKQFDGNAIIICGGLSIDTINKTASFNGNDFELTKKEFELLLYLVTNKKRLVSKDAIAAHLWEYDMAGNYDFIYTHIKNLRRKLWDAGKADYIKSVYGMGYKFIGD